MILRAAVPRGLRQFHTIKDLAKDTRNNNRYEFDVRGIIV